MSQHCPDLSVKSSFCAPCQQGALQRMRPKSLCSCSSLQKLPQPTSSFWGTQWSCASTVLGAPTLPSLEWKCFWMQTSSSGKMHGTRNKSFCSYTKTIWSMFMELHQPKRWKNGQTTVIAASFYCTLAQWFTSNIWTTTYSKRQHLKRHQTTSKSHKNLILVFFFQHFLPQFLCPMPKTKHPSEMFDPFLFLLPLPVRKTIKIMFWLSTAVFQQNNSMNISLNLFGSKTRWRCRNGAAEFACFVKCIFKMQVLQRAA